MVVLWFLWRARNEVPFQGCSFSVAKILFNVDKFLSLLGSSVALSPSQLIVDENLLVSSWFKSVPPTKVTTKAVSWLPPAAGWYKLNTDASVRDTSASGDGVLRDHSGKVVFAFYKEFGELDVLAAEAAALEHGLQLCGSRGYLPLIIEVDSQILVQLINAIGRAKWPLCNVLDRIRHCMLQLSASITHIFRKANSVADFLSSLNFSGRHIFSFNDLPDKCRSLVRLDSFSFPYIRQFNVKVFNPHFIYLKNSFFSLSPPSGARSLL